MMGVLANNQTASPRSVNDSTSPWPCFEAKLLSAADFAKCLLFLPLIPRAFEASAKPPPAGDHLSICQGPCPQCLGIPGRRQPIKTANAVVILFSATDVVAIVRGHLPVCFPSGPGSYARGRRTNAFKPGEMRNPRDGPVKLGSAQRANGSTPRLHALVSCRLLVPVTIGGSNSGIFHNKTSCRWIPPHTKLLGDRCFSQLGPWTMATGDDDDDDDNDDDGGGGGCSQTPPYLWCEWAGSLKVSHSAAGCQDASRDLIGDSAPG